VRLRETIPVPISPPKRRQIIAKTIPHTHLMLLKRIMNQIRQSSVLAAFAKPTTATYRRTHLRTSPQLVSGTPKLPHSACNIRRCNWTE